MYLKGDSIFVVFYDGKAVEGDHGLRCYKSIESFKKHYGECSDKTELIEYRPVEKKPSKAPNNCEYIQRIRDAAYGLAVAARDDSNVKHIMHELLMIANHMEVMQRMENRKDGE